MNKYKISVIIAIYNVENYLEEAIISVLTQTMNFKQNIQMILVNDGSTDNSEEICLKYKKLYPNNIVYLKQENAGVSAARNHGLKYAQGEFINFLDGDDKWETEVFEKAYRMFKQNDDIDIIGVRQKFFEALNGYTELDYKFDKDKIIDIFNEYDHIQTSVTAGFIRYDAIGDIRFDEKIKFAEDVKFLGEIIIKKCKLGIIASSVHLYRKRFNQTSAVQNKNYMVETYSVTPICCYKYLFDLSKKKFGFVIKYFQYCAMYDYQWRVRDLIPEMIPKDIVENYIKVSTELFKEMDDEVIIEQRLLYSEYKVEILKLKYDNNISDKMRFYQNAIYFSGKKLIPLKNNDNILNITFFEHDNNNVIIRGMINLSIPESKYKINAVINDNEKFELCKKNIQTNERKMFNECFLINKGFELIIPAKQIKKIHFELVYNKNYVTNIDFKLMSNAKLDNNIKLYYIKDNVIFYYYNEKILVKNKNLKNIIKLKLRYLKQLIMMKKIKVIAIRLVYYLLKAFKHKEIWIISDRPQYANDNGFAFFKYVNKLKNKKIKSYFLIQKNSKDFNKVKHTGKYLIFNSLKAKMYFLLADKIISSHVDAWSLNLLGNRDYYYRDLYNSDFIFLQHGITKDDSSSWLNVYQKKIDLLITAVKDEYKSILDGKYGYKKDVVKLTGFPRYDLLENKRENIIVIMPTWRQDIVGNLDFKERTRKYSENFKNTNYYKFYNKLINDSRIVETLHKKGYKGVFIIHPMHVKNAIDFKGNDVIKVEQKFSDYSEIFAKASLLVTDYSSVAFDFAYLNKPVIYTQFDKEKFFKNHTYTEGYFSYEENGFGPVIYDYDTTVNTIIEYIENECKLDKKYEKRIKNFYEFRDKNNCERVYKEIIKNYNKK